MRLLAGAHRFHERAGARLHACGRLVGKARLVDEARERLAFVAQVMVLESGGNRGKRAIHSPILLGAGFRQSYCGGGAADSRAAICLRTSSMSSAFVFSITCSKAPCGIAPGCAKTTIWSRNTISVGIERIWKCA